MDLNRALQQLSFTQNEAEVYLALLRVGRTPAGKLAREAGLERTSTYHALNRLLQYGLVSYVHEGGCKVFAPAAPSKIAELFREKARQATALVPALTEIQHAEREHESILKFVGLGGVKSVLNDVLRTCPPRGEYLVIGMEGQLSQRLPTFAQVFAARKDAKRLCSRALVGDTGAAKLLSMYTSIRYVPQETISPVNINIYGEKVALIIWSDNPEAIIIDNPAAAKAFRSYFEFMWKHAGENVHARVAKH